MTTAATTPIQTFKDILDAMERDPQLQEALRQYVLDEEIRRLPAAFQELRETVAELARTLQEFMASTNARLERLEAGQDELKAGQGDLKVGQERLEAGQDELNTKYDELKVGQERLEAGQGELNTKYDELKDGQNRMQGQLNRVTGTDYERRVVRRLRRSARWRFGLERAAVVHSVTLSNIDDLLTLLDEAYQAGTISEAETDDAERVDIVISDEAAGRMAYVATEVSVNIDRHDVERAARRAAVIARAADCPATAAVAGESITDEVRAHADASSVAVVVIEP